MEIDLSFSDIELLAEIITQQIQYLEDNRYRFSRSLDNVEAYVDGGQSVREEIEDIDKRINKLKRIREELKK